MASRSEKGASPTHELSGERREMFENMSAADPTIGAEVVGVAEVSTDAETDLSWMSPEARENAEEMIREFGGVAVSEEVTVTPDVLRHEVFEVDGVLPLPIDEHTEEASKGIDEISDFLAAEAAGGGSDGSSAETTTSFEDEPGPEDAISPSLGPVAREKTTMPLTPARVEYLDREKTRVSGSIDTLLKESKGVAVVERYKAAKSEKEHRRNVREVNKGGVKQEVRDAKLNLKITEQAYNRRGKRILKRNERKALKKDIANRQAKGDINILQAFFANRGVRKVARGNVEKKAVVDIRAAETKLNRAETAKDAFFDQYGRRNNSTRKNLQRVRGRIATHTNYRGAGEVITSPMPSLAESWSSDEWVKKRADEVKRKESEAKARADAARKARVATTRTRHPRPAATKPVTRPAPKVTVTGPGKSFS